MSLLTPYLLATSLLATVFAQAIPDAGTQAAPQAPDPEAVSATRLAATLDELCRLPRLAGSIEALAAIDYAVEVFTDAGLSVSRQPYLCYLPRQSSQSLQMRQPDGDWAALDLREVGFAEDERTLSNHVPPMHGLTAAGRAEGRLWYAGYGTEREFEELEAKFGREDMAGASALIRYGALYRGLKVANAEQFGFAGALLYTDAEDDGRYKGVVLPDGPWRPASGIQRGSVYNSDGDPLPPGWAALEFANRIHPDQAEGLVRIPSLPISSGNAARLLAGAERKLGPLQTDVRLALEQDTNLVEIEDVLGIVRGSTSPEEWVIFGAHRDSWGYGATDNGTGSAVLLETARIVGAALKRGWKPQRTLIFATWDAEEWGLVGSTEWVEQHRGELLKKAVAYVNMDVVATGPNFGASCTPGLVAATAAACTERGVDVPARLGVPGGGSDHVPFLELAGVEVLNFGFHGGSGVYHSALDTPYLVDKFLDPGFEHHRSAAAMAVSLVNHLSAADFRVDGRDAWIRQMLKAVERWPNGSSSAELAKLRIANAALRYALTLKDSPRASEVTAAFRFHRAFLPLQGRSLLWRSEGYGSAWFPEVTAALESGDDQALEKAVTAILDGFSRLSTL
jgi:N-acetylated-alpha-linked acidic dipeptidase